MENRLPPNRPNARSPLAVIEFIAIVFISLFVCGALFFGYQIYDTAREAVIALGLPDVDSPPAISAAPQPTR